MRPLSQGWRCERGHLDQGLALRCRQRACRFCPRQAGKVSLVRMEEATFLARALLTALSLALDKYESVAYPPKAPG